MRDFFKMPHAEVTMSRHFISQDEFVAYAKRHLCLCITGGKLVMGIKDEFNGKFIALKNVPGALVSDEIREKAPVRWWQWLRMWRRRSLTPAEKP